MSEKWLLSQLTKIILSLRKEELSELLSHLPENSLRETVDYAKTIRRDRELKETLEKDRRRRDALPRLPNDGTTPSPDEMKKWGKTLWIELKDPQMWSKESRQIDLHEMEVVRKFIESNTERIVCRLHNACMGFGIGISVYLAEHPPCPSVDYDPEFLFCITSKHLWFENCEPSPFVEPSTKGRQRFETGWRIFSPFTHNKRNAKMLELCGEVPRDKHHYDY